MLSVDFHSHTFLSQCGIHTHVEMLEQAKRRGLAALAITDHGPALQGRHPSPVYERMGSPVPGIRYLKGIESNVIDEDGAIDVPGWLLQWLDVVLLGLHVRYERPDPQKDWTDPLVAAMQRNPCVDIITHPVDPYFPLDIEQVAEAARECGVALEVNNSKLLYGRVEEEDIVRLLHVCRDVGCRIVMSSDAHSLEEVGNDSLSRPLVEQSGIAPEQIVNLTLESSLAFIDSRRSRKG